MSNNGGLPGSTVLFSASGTASGSQGVVTFSSASGSTLTAGTGYWAEIVPATSSADGWFDNSTGVTGDAAYSNNGGPYMTEGTVTSAAFTVSGTAAATAPEPGTLALLALSGVPLVGGLARRRKRVWSDASVAADR